MKERDQRSPRPTCVLDRRVLGVYESGRVPWKSTVCSLKALLCVFLCLFLCLPGVCGGCQELRDRWLPQFRSSPSHTALVDHLRMSYPVSLSQLLTEGPFNDCLNSFIYDSGMYLFCAWV